ncbi:MAG: tyrosine-type recombinase/integrase [Pseudomonadota bacterium]
MRKQRSTSRPTDTANPSFRPSFDRDAPIDAHDRHKIDYLTETEVMKLVAGAKASRNPERDQLFIFMLFRHGYRESEAIMARRDWVDLEKAVIWIERLKKGMSRYHPLAGDELRRLRKYLRSRNDSLPWLFVSERQQPLSSRSARRIVAEAARHAKLRHVHPHMLRHSCGFHLQERGHDTRMIQEYLGHASINSTQLYTRLSAKAFEGVWR